jgi:hypothetical protein
VSVLDHLAQAAAILLLIELSVFLLIFCIVTGGLAFGLRWVRGRTGSVFGKANYYVELAAKDVHMATDYVAKPVIVASGFAETARATAVAVRSRVRTLRSSASTSVPGSAVREAIVTIPSATDVTQPVGAVTESEEDTTIVPALPDTAAEPTPPSTP